MSITRRTLLVVTTGCVGLVPSIWPNAQPAVSNSSTWYEFGGTREALLKNAETFFGTAKGNYIDMRPHGGATESVAAANKRDMVSQQFEAVFNSVPLAPTKYTDGSIIYATRLADSYATYALLMTNGDSNDIVATALVHHRCGIWNKSPERHLGENPCETERMTLTVFYSGKVTPNPIVTKKFKSWTLKRLANFRKTGPAAKVIVPDLLRIEVRKI